VSKQNGIRKGAADEKPGKRSKWPWPKIAGSVKGEVEKWDGVIKCGRRGFRRVEKLGSRQGVSKRTSGKGGKKAEGF